jgi:competence protein ComEC
MASKNAPLERLIGDYKIAERIHSINTSTIHNSYQFLDKSIVVLDSTGVYSPIKNPHYLILTQSPKINLARLLDSIQPKMIIADGSNYKSYVSAWQQTCRYKKTPFHYTGDQGAFTIHLEH